MAWLLSPLPEILSRVTKEQHIKGSVSATLGGKIKDPGGSGRGQG